MGTPTTRPVEPRHERNQAIASLTSRLEWERASACRKMSDWIAKEQSRDHDDRREQSSGSGGDTLFNKRDYAAAERYWSPNYVQHSAHIAPGRDGLFNLVKSIPATLRYEHGTIVAERDFVIVHGRFSGIGQAVNWIAADILRIQDGILLEHWDVIQDEASREQSKSGLPMFGDAFPK